MSDTVEIEDVTCKRATDKAILVVIDGEEMWIPKSQIDDDSEVYDGGHSGRLVITEWIAREKNIVP